MPIEHRMLSRSVEKAQKKVEENHFASRKSLLEYDQVNNDQREIIYRERLKVLNGEDIHSDILYMINSIIDRKVIESYEGNEISAKLLNDNLLPIIPLRQSAMLIPRKMILLKVCIRVPKYYIRKKKL